MITLDTYGKQGFSLAWPWHPSADVRISIINKVKLCAGFNFNQSRKMWVSEGPEVILDMDRYELWPYITSITPAATERASAFRVRLENILEAMHRPHEGQYGYQKNGTDALVLQERGILGDDMGLGKTKQALDACAQIQALHILVLAPKTLTYNWKQECEKWYPNWIAEVAPDNKKERETWWVNCARVDPHVMIANYEKILLNDWPSLNEWDVIILDECQKLKNTSTKTHKAAKKLKGQFVFGISGTPMEIRIEELYGIMSMLRPAIFGNWMRFRDHHLVTDAWGNVVGMRNDELLKERIAPWLLRRRKADVLKELPPKLYNHVFVELEKGEMDEYKEIKQDFLDWLSEHDRSMSEANALTQILRLQQFTSSPFLLEAEYSGSKFEVLRDTINEWEGKVVVFTQFAQMANLLCKWLKTDYLISGAEKDAEKRIAIVNEFNNNPEAKVLVSTDAGAYGLNITSADLIIHYSLLWNPAKMWQREDRLHRIGQENPVNVIYLLAQNTIDEGMAKILEKRADLFKDVIDGAEDAAIKKLGSATLKKLVEGKL